MSIEQMLQQTNAVGAISRELGIDSATAQAGAAALLPSLLSGFQNPAAPAAAPQGALSGLGGLLGTIGGLGGGGLLDNVTSSQPTEVDKGNQILGQLFGSKDGSRAVAAQAAAQSGVENHEGFEWQFLVSEYGIPSLRSSQTGVTLSQLNELITEMQEIRSRILCLKDILSN
jgi:hypothetical protein